MNGGEHGGAYGRGGEDGVEGRAGGGDNKTYHAACGFDVHGICQAD